MKPLTPAQTVDALGRVRDRIAELEVEERTLCESLKESSVGRIEGKVYVATIFTTSKSSLDMDVIRSTLNAQFIADHTTSKSYLAVRVTHKLPKE